MKPVHLIIIDSWHPGLLLRELEKGSLPNIQWLVQKGQLDLNCTSIFPTVTPAALTSVVTGCGITGHGVQGVLWYCREKDRYINYWPHPHSLVTGAFRQIIRDILTLGEAHPFPTIFELLEAEGIDCASINFPISPGGYRHHARLGYLFSTLSGLPRQLPFQGPRWLTLGRMLPPQDCWPRGLDYKLGLTDRIAGDYSATLIQRHRPPFMLTYLAEHDLHSHHHGPYKTAFSLKTVDQQVGKMLQAYGSPEAAIRNAKWILVGDHAQSPIGGFKGYGINVYKALGKYRVVPLDRGGLRTGQYDLAVAPNDRCCLIYLPDGKKELLRELIQTLIQWPSLDQVFWIENGWTRCQQGLSGKTCRWKADGDYRDKYGQSWAIEGDLSILGAYTIDHSILYNCYPDILHRVDDLLKRAQAPDLVANAKPGYEFNTGFTMGKGNHGSLAAGDSLVPLLTCGVNAPTNARITDLVPLILQELGLPVPSHLRK